MKSSPHIQSNHFDRIRHFLCQPVSGASLGIFRICFGLIMFAHAVKYLYPQGGTTLKDYLYHETTFNFTYPGLGWIQAFPEPWWTIWFVVMGVSALGVAAGVFFRASAITLCVTYSYIFLTEVAKYNNHYYLMCLLAFLLATMPADNRFSISAWMKNRKQKEPAAERTVPFWTIFILRSQLFIVYFYGGIAKLDADWLTGIPMVGKGREILNYWTPIFSLPEINPIYFGLFICWTGLFFDLTIGFLLICRRTRLMAFGLVTIFHVSNHFLFPIGLFPTMALAVTLIFFEPDWPIRFVQWFKTRKIASPNWKWSGPGLLAIPVVGILLGWADRKSGEKPRANASLSMGMTTFLMLFLVIQTTVPLRHYFIAGDAKWTEEGQEFSWRMMLRSKDASHLIYYIHDTSLFAKDQNGHKHLSESAWPQDRPKTIFVPIDCVQFNWGHHPGITTTFEPNVGLRVIYRLNPNDDMAQVKSALAAQWQKMFGREVIIEESVGLEEVIEKLDERISGSDATKKQEAFIEQIRELAQGLANQSTLGRERNLSSLGTYLHGLTQTEARDFVQPLLKRLHPFLLQGAQFPNERFVIIDDPSINVDSLDPEKLTGGKEFLVWMDLGRLRANDWQKLPQWFVTFENRDLRVVWNYANDLNNIQRQKFTTCPWMIRQFARHIAGQWKTMMGKKPQVRVVSHVMMNYRVPQSLIDPSVDLATVEYQLLSHNPWVLPLQAKVGSATKHGQNPIR